MPNSADQQPPIAEGDPYTLGVLYAENYLKVHPQVATEPLSLRMEANLMTATWAAAMDLMQGMLSGEEPATATRDELAQFFHGFVLTVGTARERHHGTDDERGRQP